MSLNQLILKGMHRTYDELISEYDFKDYAFSKLRERYKAWTGNSMEEKLFDSFDMRDEHGKLTNAGALLADDSPIRHSRLFCTRWNGLDKSGGMVDALDSAEYSGSLIILLNEGVGFVKRNMKTRWKKTADSRIEMPDYCERSVFEALVNALIHRDYLILGSEVHIDIYDDRLTIYSPGGMPDGTRIQERDLSSISSTRRNPVLADIFGRLGYMERQGSGFKKITETYRAAHNYRDELEPKFYSDVISFQVTLYNLNYGTVATANRVTIEDENVAIEVAIDRLNASQGTIAKAKAVFANMGIDGVFGRSDIAAITKDSVTAAGNLITKLKNADLIEPVSGFGKGKYKFIAQRIRECPLSAMQPITGICHSYTSSVRTVSSARLRMLFMRRTHSIWSAALSASVTSSCLAISETMIAIRSLQAWSISARCRCSVPLVSRLA